MDRRLFLAAAIAALVSPGHFAHAQAADPVTAVKAFYDAKVPEEKKPYSKRLKALYDAAIAKSKELDEPVAGLDFDPTVDGQDSEDNYQKTLRYKEASRDAAKAQVKVNFKNFKPVELTYDLVFENGGWKVDDIARLAKKDGWRLSTLLAAGAKGQ